MDIQPLALICSTIILIINNKTRMIRPLNYFWIILAIATVLLIISLLKGESEWFIIFRKYMNYLSLTLIVTAGYKIFTLFSVIKEKWIKNIIILWFIVGLIEMIIPSTADIIMPGSRTTIGRGVVGLSMEPSFYGYMSFFFFIIATNFKKNKNMYIAISLIQLLLFAKSAVAVIYLITYFIAVFIKHFFEIYKISRSKLAKNIILMSAFFAMACIIITKISEALPDSRMVIVFNRFINNIDKINGLNSIYFIDFSTGERLDAILSSFEIFFDNCGVPIGFDYENIGWRSLNRIMSGYGAALVELGFIGIILISLLFFVLYRGFDICVAISVSLTMFSAVQLASPTFAFLIAWAIFKRTEKNKVVDTKKL